MLCKHLVFMDTFQFMAGSLEKLAASLLADAFKYTSSAFQNEKLQRMKKKGDYPYDFMDSVEKFDDQQLPSKDDFYSQLNSEHISDKPYQHAQKNCSTFELKNMGQYHDLYLESDILLLSDVFENFRITCLQYYKLDPCHYFSSPALRWDAMLKMTGIQFELMTDVEQFQFIEKGMPGGISYIAHRHDETKPSKYIMTEKQIDKLVNNVYINPDADTGYIFEVDLEYPAELHELHKHYPVAAEK